MSPPSPNDTGSLAPLDASRLQVTLADPAQRSPPDFADLKFGATFAPHMLTVDWDEHSGWHAPQIVPYGPLSLSPAAPTFHYASGLFEGLKAYRSARGDGSVLLFRPDMNMKRMNRSAARLGLPTFDEQQAIELIRQLVRLDAAWVPPAAGASLYIRPTLIGTTPTLGVHKPGHAKWYVITSPVGSYFSTGGSGARPRGVRLLARDDIVRAWTNGTGSYKLGANYGPTLVPGEEAEQAGYDQILWVFQREVTEVGAMNFFVVFACADGTYEVATAPLEDGCVLPGVTRDSILALLRAHASGACVLPGLPPPAQVRVAERKVTIDELLAASAAGTLAEAFGTGTAAIISPVEEIAYHGTQLHVPIGDDGHGPFARVLLKQLADRQRGAQSHPGWSVPV